ncbi:MAG: dephospho-CoA kinase [Halomonas sp.]|nr:dephospho-CoA kinase [Halomonas sp.]MDN6298423.1 dephospho-CoA kinase [Halomonas sp.]MDN6313675.1 dephospho-CoA kinase [Halomonas sp.]MDN6337018.1 dephospho-CoA kinase [Halomonas sp.]
MIIGLTGGIGSGKSTVARAFAARGVAWVDADDVAREIVTPGEPALDIIAGRYGKRVLQQDGTLDRAALRDIIFATPAEREWLESVTHPRVRERLLAYLERLQATPAQGAPSPYVLLVSPLLFESGQNALVERCLVVDLPETLQRERTLARDNVSREQIEAILAAQLSREQRLSHGCDVIDNSGDESHMREQVSELDARYRALAQ